MAPDNDSFRGALDTERSGLLRDFRDFMAENAKWWLTPFLLVFGLLGAALVLGASGAAPFIYTIF